MIGLTIFFKDIGRQLQGGYAYLSFLTYIAFVDFTYKYIIYFYILVVCWYNTNKTCRLRHLSIQYCSLKI